MLNKQAIFVLSLIAMVMAEDSDITKFMKHLEVIPDVILEGPQDFLKITYDSGVTADKGVELTPTQVQNQPKVEWTCADANSYYTLIMTDPDAPSRENPKFREWHHWLVVNIPCTDLSQGEVLSPYLGSGPPKDSGLHRYVFLLYKQPKKLDFNEKRLTDTDMEGRALFSTKKFAKKYELGVPVAGNFYQAQWDDYVPKLYEKLGV